jgi:hypothetical protein
MSDASGSAVTRWLSRAPAAVLTSYAIVAAFSVYFCMYAFRKPFAAGAFADAVDFPGLPPLKYKALLIIAQVLGYCVSKFAGIKVVSELSPAKRAWAILVCIGVAEAALALFGLVPRPWGAVCLVVNGLPLGMVWGLVYGFLEGRRVSDVLGAALASSFIVSSGFVKSVGLWLLAKGVPEHWMPVVTGLIFFPFLLAFVVMLAKLPPPSAEDERQCVRREPMNATARRAFFKAYAPGLVSLTFLYFFLTAYRDFRDNFAPEIWRALGYADTPSILTTSEVIVTVGVLVVLGALMAIRNSRTALLVVHVAMMAGAALVGLATLAFRMGWLGPAPWMILVGLGLYMAYVPYNCILFDRLIGAVGVVGTAGFLIYVSDAFGYLGSVALLLYKEFGQPNLSWLEFFTGFSYFTSALCVVCFVASLGYFVVRTRRAAAIAGA